MFFYLKNDFKIDRTFRAIYWVPFFAALVELNL
ncbi:hypothetical protein CF65_02489 [Aggregatibacter actinomycetemcomitans HK1651]|nr:hypothetical protein CF65_02489 [Aggregatibacter actinomycetemcomitans HK1651]